MTRHDGHAGEWWAPASNDESRPLLFECTSHGDVVSGSALPPAGNAAAPLLLIAGAPATDALTLQRSGAELGFVASTIDLPLQGERTSVKLSERVLAVVDGPQTRAFDAGLAEDWSTQSALDLRAAAATLGRHPRIDATRVVVAALGVASGPALDFARDEGAVRAVVTIGGKADDARAAALAPRPVHAIASFDPAALQPILQELLGT